MKKVLMIIVLGMLLISSVAAIEFTYCCEKTESGAWCQNAAKDKCDENYQMAATSCQSTGYCKLGCCFDSQEGTCMENTPQRTCNDNGGVWEDSASCDIPQCGLGCCLIGEQAAFVTQTRCKRLSALYGLEINFRSDLTSEVECIASSTEYVKGACVYEEDYTKTCEFVSQEECKNRQDAKFYKDVLCSSEALGTNCGPTEKTTCVEGKDEVYFIDNCGNIANIYDSSKIKDKTYWSEVVKPAESCGTDISNAESKTCGNCDYYLGSSCQEAERGGKANYGDYICGDLSCEYEGETYQHGETWCMNSKGANSNLPGSRYFRMVCYNGEVSVEPCADYRNEICLEVNVNGFKEAGCVVNKWQDCYAQDDESKCENSDARDCKWVSGHCVPSYSPGFNFWEEEGTCAAADESHTVTYTKGLLGDWKCSEGCEYCTNKPGYTGCTGGDYESQMEEVCISLGDCGISKNYIGIAGKGTSSLKVTEQQETTEA